MTPIEMNAVLTFAGLLDPRMKRTDPVDAADRAEAWAEVVPAVVTVGQAKDAVTAHYRVSSEPFMVADLIALADVDVPNESSLLPDLTGLVLAESKRAALAELGYTPEQYDADERVRADVAARWTAKELEA